MEASAKYTRIFLFFDDFFCAGYLLLQFTTPDFIQPNLEAVTNPTHYSFCEPILQPMVKTGANLIVSIWIPPPSICSLLDNAGSFYLILCILFSIKRCCFGFQICLAKTPFHTSKFLLLSLGWYISSTRRGIAHWWRLDRHSINYRQKVSQFFCAYSVWI